MINTKCYRCDGTPLLDEVYHCNTCYTETEAAWKRERLAREHAEKRLRAAEALASEVEKHLKGEVNQTHQRLEEFKKL